MTFGLGLILVAIVLMIAGLVLKRTAIVWGGGGFWLASSGQFYLTSVTTWDIYYITMFFCFAMAIITIMLGFAVKEKSDTPISDARWNEGEFYEDNMKKRMEFQRRLQMYNELTGGRKKEPSVWDRLPDDRKN